MTGSFSQVFSNQIFVHLKYSLNFTLWNLLFCWQLATRDKWNIICFFFGFYSGTLSIFLYGNNWKYNKLNTYKSDEPIFMFVEAIFSFAKCKKHLFDGIAWFRYLFKSQIAIISDPEQQTKHQIKLFFSVNSKPQKPSTIEEFNISQIELRSNVFSLVGTFWHRQQITGFSLTVICNSLGKVYFVQFSI